MPSRVGWPVLVALLVVAACGDGRPESAAGSYRFDRERTERWCRRSPSTSGPDAAQLRQLLAGVDGSFALAADGSYAQRLRLLGVRHDDDGTWRLDGEKLRVRSRRFGDDVFRLQDGRITVERQFGGVSIALIFDRAR